MTIARDRDLTAGSRAIFKCLIISDEPFCVLGRAVTRPERPVLVLLSASKLARINADDY